MSFRLRILALVVLVGVTATGATAWLTMRQVSRQVNVSAVADRATIERITEELAEYGRTRGGWEGVASLVATQARATDQRIRMVTTEGPWHPVFGEHGNVLVDTDHLAGREARPPTSPAIEVNPRPVLDLPAGGEDAPEAAIEAFLTYRHQVIFNACLVRLGGEVHATGDSVHGVALYAPGGNESPARVSPEGDITTQWTEWDERTRHCYDDDAAAYHQRPFDSGAFQACSSSGAETEQHRCLGSVFDQEADAFAPVPVNLYLGANEILALPPAAGRVLSSATLVAATAIAGALLISRRVLRPIGALTAAARRLGAGNLTERVPVLSKDELAELGRAFNRMADALLRSEERQRRLIADVAHELRTPLANLRGYLEALKDGVIAPGPDLFTSLHEEALLQQRLVDDLQDLTLAEAGSLVYHPEPVELGDLLEASRAAHQAAADAAGVRLAVRVPEPVPVRVDPHRFRQVIANLVTNALRATEPGGNVRLGASRTEGSAVVTVSDTGVGIAPADLPHVFDRFWRADTARGRTTGGSGLGLAIARQIITDHSGTITVRSGPGTGTTFTITLPGGGGGRGGGTA